MYIYKIRRINCIVINALNQLRKYNFLSTINYIYPTYSTIIKKS